MRLDSITKNSLKEKVITSGNFNIPFYYHKYVYQIKFSNILKGETKWKNAVTPKLKKE